jgi:hypothetical protein
MHDKLGSRHASRANDRSQHLPVAVPSPREYQLRHNFNQHQTRAVGVDATNGSGRRGGLEIELIWHRRHL